MSNPSLFSSLSLSLTNRDHDFRFERKIEERVVDGRVVWRRGEIESEEKILHYARIFYLHDSENEFPVRFPSNSNIEKSIFDLP